MPALGVLWEYSDNAFCISQRRNVLFSQATLISVCLFVFSFVYYV